MQTMITRFVGSRQMDYLEIFDCTGRAVRDDKRGSIPEQALKILDRLGIDEKVWLSHMRPRKRRHPVAVGAWVQLRDYAQETGRKWVAGQTRFQVITAIHLRGEQIISPPHK